MQNTIFVQVASYRDPDLYNTVDDMFANSKYKDNLHLSICWQNSKEDAWENIDRLKSVSNNIEIIDIDYKDSKGVCWARNMVQSRYSGEKYTLQIDSHHRFVEDWDDKLIDMLELLRSDGYNKPILTTYAPSFDPNQYPIGRIEELWKMNFDRFIPEGAVFFMPSRFTVYDNDEKPLPSRFYSAHFAFADGIFCQQVKHDPNFYFHGEEISIAVRAFTHGYDLFHPNKIILWHEYTRENRNKHWDDHYSWSKVNADSHRRNRSLLSIDNENNVEDFAEYGLGNSRTLKDYEKYAGISFSNRSITNDVINQIPPDLKNMQCSDEIFQKKLIRIFKHCIDINRDQVSSVTDYDFWCVVFKDSDGHDIFRKDADEKEIKILLSSKDPYIKLWREFHAESQPKQWVVWPHSAKLGWQNQIKGDL